MPDPDAHPAVRAGQDAYMELLRTGDGCPGSHDVAAAVAPAVLLWAGRQFVAAAERHAASGYPERLAVASGKYAAAAMAATWADEIAAASSVPTGIVDCRSRFAAPTGAVVACRKPVWHLVHSNMAVESDEVTWLNGDDGVMIAPRPSVPTGTRDPAAEPGPGDPHALPTTRLAGHELLGEGRVYDSRGYVQAAGVSRCSCGEVSPMLPSAYDRKRWHREHKDIRKTEEARRVR